MSVPVTFTEPCTRACWQQPEHGEPEDALARPGFADQAEDLAGRDVEGHAAQRVHVTAVAAERDVQVGDRRHQRSVGRARLDDCASTSDTALLIHCS